MHWKEPIPYSAEDLQRLAKVSKDPTIATLLLNRSIYNFEEASEFFNPDIKLLHDPYLMKDMAKAIKIISKTLKSKKRIMVYGDYDVDGTTSVTLLYTYLKNMGADLLTYVPDRYSEGYGVSLQGINRAKEENISLIIAIDCGIRAVEQVAYAKDLGIDFIICDHHLPSEEIPKAAAILNPKQSDCPYPFKDLCACGVGFKLIQAMHAKAGKDFNELLPYLDLVAIATAADLVPIVGENRILSAMGLKVLNQNPKRVGIEAILESSKLQGQNINNTDLGFKIGPRINAAGRMKHAIHSVELLIEEDKEIAKSIALEIESYNQERRTTDSAITNEALLKIEKENEIENSTTVVYDASWHRGVLGIVASRLIETHYRPTIVFGKGEGSLTASARSVKGFNIFDAISECAPLLEKFGGHKYAAGLSLLPENYEAFKTKFEEIVKNSIGPESLKPELIIEVEIPLKDLLPDEKGNLPKLYRIIRRMRPFGPGNKSPLFTTKGVIDKGSRKIGKEDKHLRLSISDASTNWTFTGIGFNLGYKLDKIDKDNFDIVYSLEENHWNGNTSLQLMIKDIR